MLNLQSNKISSIDKSIKLYRSLIQLNVSHNQLTSIPVELFILKKLQHIDVSHNQVGYTIRSTKKQSIARAIHEILQF